jgi:hypothetical protein
MNIFEIQQDLLSVFDEIEENEGELTPELEEKLEVTQENFRNKIESYINLIKIKQGEINTICAEIERLNKIAESKNKLANRLNKIIIQAVNKFGDVSKSGAKFFDYGTGKVSIRKTQVVNTNDDLIKFIGGSFFNELLIRKERNQLDVLGPITKEDIISNLENEYPQLTQDDLENIKFTISLDVNLNDIVNNEGFDYIKECMNISPNFKLGSKVSKTDLKAKLKENGSCAPNIARLDYNESLSIK